MNAPPHPKTYSKIAMQLNAAAKVRRTNELGRSTRTPPSKGAHEVTMGAVKFFVDKVKNFINVIVGPATKHPATNINTILHKCERHDIQHLRRFQ